MNSYIINESELRYEMKDRTSDLEILTKRLSKKISLKNIIVTKGRWGADLFNIKNRSIISCPAFNENTIDTVGAGDSFLATLIHYLFLKKLTSADALKLACGMGALVASKEGANCLISEEELSDFIKQ